MDMKSLQVKLGLFDQDRVVRKAQELLRLCRVHFDSSSFGVGEICKSVLCFELACGELQVSLDRQKAVRVSGMSEKAYVRSLTAMQNALGLRPKVDIRELSIKFGCVRLISTVQRVLSLYKQRFVAALPESRRISADFSRPAFTAAAFFLCSKKNKLKVDKVRLMEICGTSDPEFGNIVTSMNDLCFDLVGVEKEKRDPKTIKSNQELLPVNISGKRSRDDEELSGSDCESIDDEVDLVVPAAKRSKKAINTKAYEQWKASIIVAREALKTSSSDAVRKSTKQATLCFEKRGAAQTVSMPSS
ncbi:hypothetical protein M758_1G008400 [Ceratodon purpureus]|uniref:Origin recognition complex subunit 6 n=1 Tax=Ceratodon purpureus TaxID=3225 RepID=A0A8T0J333_CERPU|nr:hypothetical protein KC19_1G009600 [Ceratodon purpureus]KAG0628197.1 hypothetical protein M758_1G008400 [Ceratodon purpureus]